MGKRIGFLLVAAVCWTGLLGCVSADVYRIKEQEAMSLQRTNEQMEDQNRMLTAQKLELESRGSEMRKENEGLQARIEKQNEEVGYLKKRTEKLENDGEQLRERLEKQSVKIAELNMENQKLAALSRPENLLRTLGDRLSELQKQIEALAGENASLKSSQAVLRIREAAGERAEHVSKPAVEKPQAVAVSTKQKTEEVKPDQRLHDEQDQAVSDKREKDTDLRVNIPIP